MKTIRLARFTFREIVRTPAFLALLGLEAALVLAGLVTAQLFPLETGKVLVDFLWLAMGVGVFALALFVALSVLSRDIAQGGIHLFLPLLARRQYLLGRALGLMAGLAAFVAIDALLSMGAILAHISLTPPVYHAGLDWSTAWTLAGLALIQGALFLCICLFVASWASGAAEMLLFASALMMLSLLMPSIMDALNMPEVVKATPEAVRALIEAVGWLFPRQSPGLMALAAAHGASLGGEVWVAALAAFTGYGLLLTGAALALFQRRSL
ncbi:MAG: hypothetical protein R8K47_06240 [Mariprofundaceae bacterium]